MNEIEKILQSGASDTLKAFQMIQQEYEKMSKNYDNLQSEYKRTWEQAREFYLSLEKLKKEHKQVVDNYTELSKNYDNLQKEMKDVKASIVLTREQINREGRPKTLSDADIDFIHALRAEGKSLRAIAENLGVSHGTIANNLKASKVAPECTKMPSEASEPLKAVSGTGELFQGQLEGIKYTYSPDMGGLVMETVQGEPIKKCRAPKGLSHKEFEEFARKTHASYKAQLQEPKA